MEKPRVLAFAFVLLASCVSAVRVPVTSAPHAEVPSDAPSARPSHPTLPPLPPDAVPAVLGDARASAAAAPWWGDRASGYAPQTELAAALFAGAKGARAEVGALRGRMLACAVDTDYAETKFLDVTQSHGAADLRVRFGTGESAHVPKEAGESFFLAAEGDMGVLEAKGEDDFDHIVFAAPLVALRPGDPIVVVVSDRETVSLDNDIETLRATYDGAVPIVIRGAAARAECRLVDRAVVEDALATRLSALDAAVAEMDLEWHPDAHDDLFLNALAPTRITTPFEQVAALVGWDDPRVKRRLERMTVLQARFDAEVVAITKAREAALPPAAAWAPLHAAQIALRVEGLACTDAALARYRAALPDLGDGCVVRVAVRNAAARPARVAAAEHEIAGLVDVTLVDGGGRRRSMTFAGIEEGTIAPPDWEHDPAPLAPGAARVLLFRVAANDTNLEPYFGPQPPLFTGDVRPFAPLLVEALCRGRTWEERAQLVHMRVPSS